MFVVLMLSGLFAATVLAQSSAKETAASLRAQLSEVQIKKAEVQALDEQLQEDLRPENIERSFAGFGSTHPERLRELRRRQLEITRATLRIELDELDRNQACLESAIGEADTVAYWQSAGIDIGIPLRRTTCVINYR
jgi:ribosome biogenesis SPOUT family RNA methylase Rps3